MICLQILHHYHSETSLDTQSKKSISNKFALLSRLDVWYELNMPVSTLLLNQSNEGTTSYYAPPLSSPYTPPD